ncbi:MAG: pyridoxamine 5'-phosphate oxidase [Hyphomicrobiales bacterium]|nr:pyridoxamine 5'-phosphate oxidase [Hyphomicrobiales bacterium]
MNGLISGDFTEALDPWALFANWLSEAEASEINDPNAMALATVDSEGLPDVRMVLLKGYDSNGFVFYTNGQSVKGEELRAQAKAGLVFHWKSLRRQVRARGPVEIVSAAEADAYFASRPHGSQIGAWASDQSRPLADRATLEARIARLAGQYGDKAPPRPPHWLGYRIMPASIEFWQDRKSRLHDRVRFTQGGDGRTWQRERLYP